MSLREKWREYRRHRKREMLKKILYVVFPPLALIKIFEVTYRFTARELERVWTGIKRTFGPIVYHPLM
ncbi:MAG: hypothetical protein ABEK01_04510, partial [Candidatus Nanohaloarchaea archaeon]